MIPFMKINKLIPFLLFLSSLVSPAQSQGVGTTGFNATQVANSNDKELVLQTHNSLRHLKPTGRKHKKEPHSLLRPGRQSSDESTDSGDGTSDSSLSGRKQKHNPFYKAGIKDSLPLTQITTENGDVFDTIVDATLTKAGVVSLAAHQDLVKSVTCLPQGTVHVEMMDDENINDLSIEELFPTGSILVVSSAVFGPCELFPPEQAIPGTKIFPDEQDGYLRIITQNGTPQDGTVAGDVVTFLALFDELHIEAGRVETYMDDELVDVNLNPGNDNDGGLVRRLADTDLLTIPYEKELHEKIKFTASLGAQSGSFIRGFLIDKNSDGWEYRVMTLMNFDVTFEAQLLFDAGVSWTYPDEDRGDKPFEVQLAEVPIYAISLSVFKKLAKLLRLDLPNVRLGLILELLIGIEMKVEVPLEFGPKVTSVVHSGRKRFDVYVGADIEIVKWSLYNSPIQLKVDAGVLVRENQNSTMETKLDLFDGIDKPPELKLSTSLYVKPQVVVAADPILSVDAPLECGATLGARIALDPANPFPPVEDDSLLPLLFLACDTCHNLEFFIDGLIRSRDGVTIKFLEDSRFGKSFSIDELEFEFTFELLKMCLLKQFGDNTVTCGAKCCNSSYQACGDATKSICVAEGSTLSPPPATTTQSTTPTPTPPPSTTSDIEPTSTPPPVMSMSMSMETYPPLSTPPPRALMSMSM